MDELFKKDNWFIKFRESTDIFTFTHFFLSCKFNI